MAGAGLFGAIGAVVQVGGRWIARKTPTEDKILSGKQTVVLEAEAEAEGWIVEASALEQ